MNQENNEVVHKRRVRYKGTHPRSYKEKYKEHQPEKYTDTIEKVISKGSTPAGMHRSICVNEILEVLDIKPGQVGLDATLGYGGHSKAMLEKLEGVGHLYSLDVDPIELPKTKARLESFGFGPDILTIKHTNFANIDEVAKESGPINFMMADLGVSSMQIDNPERGFSFKTDGPLDLRLNPEKGQSAKELLASITQEEFAGMLDANADEPHADIIAKTVFAHMRKGKKVETTKELQTLIESALSFLPEKNRKEDIKKSCMRSFQALRIDVNNEYEVLYEFLEKIPDCLASGGKVAILSFHSGEDRLVKKSFQRLHRQGVYKEISEDFIRPSVEECATNSRARSTKLRWAMKA